MRGAAVFLVALAGAGAAMANPGPSPGCYVRDYSEAHLAAHPDQVVDEIIMSIQDFPDAGRIAMLRVLTADQGHVAKTRQGGQVFDQSMFCFENEGRHGCAIDCDGGSFFVTDETDSTLTITTDYLTVGDTEGCGGAVDLAEVQMQPVSYRLNRVDPANCDIFQ